MALARLDQLRPAALPPSGGPASARYRPRVTKQECGRSYSDKTLGRLWGLAGNECTMEDCSELLVYRAEGELLGEIAHIADLNPPGPRYRPELSCAERNAYENLILLCPNHHRLIDKIRPADWPADRLLEMKTLHEDRKGKAPLEGSDLEFVIEYITIHNIASVERSRPAASPQSGATGPQSGGPGTTVRHVGNEIQLGVSDVIGTGPVDVSDEAGPTSERD